MRKTFVACSLAAGLGLVFCQNASAAPAAGGAIGATAAAASGLTQVQFAERYGRYHTTKCYRDFVIGRYVCHTYRNW